MDSDKIKTGVDPSTGSSLTLKINCLTSSLTNFKLKNKNKMHTTIGTVTTNL